MYYILYLASLCKRRHWPEPNYDSFHGSTGYTCVVRVNGREYKADSIWDSEIMARENAAMQAYLICRNFSVNDGMYPAGHDHGGVLQGIPVAIGTGRGDKTSRYRINHNAASTDESDSTSLSGGSRSGGSSPESHDGARLMSRDHEHRQGFSVRALMYRY